MWFIDFCKGEIEFEKGSHVFFREGHNSHTEQPQAIDIQTTRSKTTEELLKRFVEKNYYNLDAKYFIRGFRVWAKEDEKNEFKHTNPGRNSDFTVCENIIGGLEKQILGFLNAQGGTLYWHFFW